MCQSDVHDQEKIAIEQNGMTQLVYPHCCKFNSKCLCGARLGMVQARQMLTCGNITGGYTADVLLELQTHIHQNANGHQGLGDKLDVFWPKSLRHQPVPFLQQICLWRPV